MRHYFLGTGAGISREERIRRRRIRGTHEDYEDLEQSIRRRYGAKQVLITRNGRSAIAAGLEYYGGAKGEVIINGFTCQAVVQGVKAAGMTPVFADIDKKTLNFNLSSLKKVVSQKTRAVIFQNTLGTMTEVDEMMKFCRKQGILVIEDLAHCVGQHYQDGKMAGQKGDLVVFSFGKEKSIDAGGGGALAVRELKPIEIKKPHEKPPKMEEFRARVYPTIGAIYRWLSYVNLHGPFMRIMLNIGWVQKSAEGEIDFSKRRLGYAQAKIAEEKLWEAHHTPQTPIRSFYFVNEREKCLAELREAGYYFDGFWYETPVAPKRYYKQAHFPEKDCPQAVWVAEHIINFPNYYCENKLTRARKIVKKYLVEDENGR